MPSLSRLVIATLLLGAIPLPTHASPPESKLGAELAARLRVSDARASAQFAERVAIYVTAPLDPIVMTRLASLGIAIVPGHFVAPVPGRHPHGFHIARAPLSRVAELALLDDVVLVESLESRSAPQDALALALTRSDLVQDGIGVPSRRGQGVALAIADSGFDLSHPDLPVPTIAWDVTDGDGSANWSSVVASAVTDHGTLVAGIVAGSGALSLANAGNGGGAYRGVAPGVDLRLYKIANDESGEAAWADEIEAIEHARATGARIYVSSYGGYSSYMDGSSAVCQTIDAASRAGMTILVAAGNRADDGAHVSATVAPSATSGGVAFSVEADALTGAVREEIRVIWRDDEPRDRNIVLDLVDAQTGDLFSEVFMGRSPRGTEGRRYLLEAALAPGSVRTFSFRVRNTAVSGAAPLVHLYRVEGKGRFETPDRSFTVSHPALCDEAIAVGAWTHRRSWTAWDGIPYRFDSLVTGTLAPFSAQGPRIDGRAKPEIVAPGAATISLRDSAIALPDSRRIDNDGVALDLSGPADYAVRQGTSMAAPHAAGIAALVGEQSPLLSPTGLRRALLETASSSDAPDLLAGFGLVDAVSALLFASNAASDADGDAAPSSGSDPDCDDANTRAWRRPSVVEGVRFADSVTLGWSEIRETGSGEWGFDTLRSTAASDFTAMATCIESNDARDRVAYDLESPAPGSAFFYLVRARNACPGDLGQGPVAFTREARLCP